MVANLQIALVQANLAWEQPEVNRTHLKELVLKAAQADVYVLPEMFTTGFTMNAEPYAETLQGATIEWMQGLAAERGAAICGSFICTEDNNYYNRFVFVTAEGVLAYYDKRHTFTLAGEEKVFTKGNVPTIVTYKGWKLCLQVCYDLRFPVWARNTVGYDVLLYCANWPVKRIAAWDVLLKARAIENMSYCVGVNRVGNDGNEIPYNGHSSVYDTLGDQMTFSEATETVLVVSLSYEAQQQARRRFKFLQDADEFTIL